MNARAENRYDRLAAALELLRNGYRTRIIQAATGLFAGAIRKLCWGIRGKPATPGLLPEASSVTISWGRCADAALFAGIYHEVGGDSIYRNVDLYLVLDAHSIYQIVREQIDQMPTCQRDERPKILDINHAWVIARDLRFPGIEICTNVNGTDLDHPRFLPFFERVRDLGLTIVAHPNGFTDGQRLAAYYLINTIGMPLDSSVFLARTILSGLFEKVQGLDVVVAHGGGYLPSYPARYDHAWRARSDARNGTSEPPSAYLRRLYFDTMLFDTFDLSVLIQRYGADHVLLGTDYPYDMGEADPVGLVCSVEGLSDEDRGLILGGNAARLLHLGDRPRSATRAVPSSA